MTTNQFAEIGAAIPLSMRLALMAPMVPGLAKAARAAADAEAQMRHLAAIAQATAHSLSGFRLLYLASAPPPPKTESGMTAREYRAARRRYARAISRARRWDTSG